VKLTLYLAFLGASPAVASPSQPPPGYRIVKTQHGIASVYWPGDGHCGTHRADGKRFTKTQCHIAHRFWPLGRRVRVCSKRTGLCTLSHVRDRGPFGACDELGINPRTLACRGQWSLKIRRHHPGTWRGVADLSVCVSKRIRHRGLSRVRVELLARTKGKVVQWERKHRLRKDSLLASMTTTSSSKVMTPSWSARRITTKYPWRPRRSPTTRKHLLGISVLGAPTRWVISMATTQP